MPRNVSLLSAFLMCLHGLSATVSRLFGSLGQNDSPSHNYATITNEREHIQSNKRRESRNVPLRKSVVNRQRDGAANTGKPENLCKPRRPGPPNIDNGRGPGDGPPKKFRHVNPPRRPDPPASGADRAQVNGRPKQLADVQPPPRPDPPFSRNGQGPTNGMPRKIGEVQPPPRPDPPSGGGSRQLTEGRLRQIGDVPPPPKLTPPSGVGGRELTGGRPKQLGDILRLPRPDPHDGQSSRGPTAARPKQLEDVLSPSRQNPPSTLGGRRLSDIRRKELGDILRPQRPDPPMSSGSRKVNECSPSSPESTASNDIKVTMKTGNSPKKSSASPVKKPATIKLPKRRSSIQKTTAPQKPVVESQPASSPIETEGNRIAAVKQRLFEMQNAKKRESRKISIPMSKSEGNVAKKTRSLEDKLFAGAGLAPTLFPLFVKPKKNLSSSHGGKPAVERSLSAGSCAYSSNFEVFFNP